MQRLSLPLLGEGDAPATYTVRLLFRIDTDAASLPKVILQGKDAAASRILAKKPSRVHVVEERRVAVDGLLIIELKPSKTGVPAVLCAVEVLRTGEQEITLALE